MITKEPIPCRICGYLTCGHPPLPLLSSIDVAHWLQQGSVVRIQSIQNKPIGIFQQFPVTNKILLRETPSQTLWGRYSHGVNNLWSHWIPDIQMGELFERWDPRLHSAVKYDIFGICTSILNPIQWLDQNPDKILFGSVLSAKTPSNWDYWLGKDHSSYWIQPVGMDDRFRFWKPELMVLHSEPGTRFEPAPAHHYDYRLIQNPLRWHGPTGPVDFLQADLAVNCGFGIRVYYPDRTQTLVRRPFRDRSPLRDMDPFGNVMSPIPYSTITDLYIDNTLSGIDIRFSIAESF